MPNLDGENGSVAEAIKVVKQLDYRRPKNEIFAVEFRSGATVTTDLDFLNQPQRWGEHRLAVVNLQFLDSAKIQSLHGLDKTPSILGE